MKNTIFIDNHIDAMVTSYGKTLFIKRNITLACFMIYKDTFMATPSNPIPSVIGLVNEAPENRRAIIGAWIVIVKCPYCGEHHTHSAPKGPDENPGFRIAHCRADRQGYNIVLK